MIKCIRVSNYEELVEITEFFGKPQILEDLTKEQWNFWFPLFAYEEDGEVFLSDVLDKEVLREIHKDFYHQVTAPCDSSVIKKILPYIGCPNIIWAKMGFEVRTYWELPNNEVYTNIGAIPKLALEQDAVSVTVTRGDLCKLTDAYGNFEFLRELYELPNTFGIEDTLVVTGIDRENEDFALLQLRGTKKVVRIPRMFLVQIGSVVRFKQESNPTGATVEGFNDVINELEKFYKDLDFYISSSFTYCVKSNAPAKSEYLNWIFGNTLDYRIGVTDHDRAVIIKHHPKFKEMIDGLKSLGIDTDARMPEILKNGLMVDGKIKRVTGILQNAKLGRFDDVFNYPQTLFPDEVTISINPIEFASASYNIEREGRSGDLSSSCYAPSGSYHCGVWAYYQSKQTSILKIKNANKKTFFRTWVSFDVDNVGIIFGRKYGSISDTQHKTIRYILESLLSNYLSLPNYWRCSKDIRVEVDYDSSNTYWDSPTYVVANKAVGSTTLFLDLPSGIDSEGDCSESGEFGGNTTCCEDCGERHDEDDMTYISDHGYVCEHCVQDYHYSDRRNEYIHEDNCIYIEDDEDWDFDGNAHRYICVDGAYYSEIPDGYVLTADGEYDSEDECFYCEISEQWYSCSSHDQVTVWIDGEDKVAKLDNVTFKYQECPHCCTIVENRLRKCPSCGERIK